MEIFLKQGVAVSIVFPLIVAGSGDRKSGATLSAGDFKIGRHTGGEWTISNPATAIPMEIGTTGLYELPLTAAELISDDQKYPVIITGCDAIGEEWEDQAIIIRLFDTDSDDMESAVNIDTQLSAVHGSGRWGGGNGGDKSLEYTLTNSNTHLPVEGATIKLFADEDMDGIVIDEQITDINGEVRFENLIAGIYYLRISKAGFTTTTDTEVVA
jgi:hypothetical protein